MADETRSAASRFRLRRWESWVVTRVDGEVIGEHRCARHWTERAALRFAKRVAHQPMVLVASMDALLRSGRMPLADPEVRRAA